MSHASVQVISALAPERATAPSHGVAIGTPIRTLEGDLPVEYLSPGDRVLTRGGARKLRQIEVTTIRNARAVLIGADTLGDNQPGGPMVVAASQPILIRDWRAKALCGVPAALIPAARLADGEYIRGVVLDEVRLYTLSFDAAEIIYAGGIELACEAIKVSA